MLPGKLAIMYTKSSAVKPHLRPSHYSDHIMLAMKLGPKGGCIN